MARDAKHARSQLRATPAVALLPLLALYVLISLSSISGLDSLSDEWRYLAFADHVRHGFYALENGAPDLFLWHGPGLPLLLTPFVALNIPVEVTRIALGPLPLYATLLVFHHMARWHLEPRPALIATYALGLYLPFFTLIQTIHVEPVASLSLTLAAFFFVRGLETGDRADGIRAAAALAVLALSRVEYGWVLVAALVASGAWLLISGRSEAARLSVIATGLALVACVPWLAYTYAKADKPLYWGNSGGVSLYWMTAPGTLGEWHGLAEPLRNPHLASSRPLFTEIRNLPPEEGDSRLQHAALENIKDDPAHYLANVVNNVGRLLFDAPYGSADQQPRAMLYTVPNGLLIALLLAAFVIALRFRRTLRPEIVPVAAFTLLGFGIHAFVSGYARMVVPLVPVAAWLALAVLADHVRIVSRSSQAAARI
jgi:hypothetical protein